MPSEITSRLPESILAMQTERPIDVTDIQYAEPMGRDLHPLERLAILILATSAIYLRMPTLFANPQFWGEDMVFYGTATLQGARAVMQTVSGYILLVPWIPSLFATRLPPALAPAILLYASVFLTLLVVWFATSPRFIAPLRPLIALALVVVAPGFEVLGTITNVQWILPIGVLILLFSKTPETRSTAFVDIAFVGLTMLTGPFCLFFIPLIAWRIYVARALPEERARLLAFMFFAILGSALQVYFLHMNSAYALGIGTTMDYSRTVWVTLPFKQMLSPIGWQSLFDTRVHVEFAVSALIVILLACISLKRPFRDLKLAAFAFAVLVAVSGMWKYRAALPIAGWRYFYIPNVVIILIICCSVRPSRLLAWLAGGVLCFEIAMLIATANTPRILEDLQWKARSRFISAGLPANIPTSPPGWMLSLPKREHGALSDISEWGGKPISAVTVVEKEECAGGISNIAPAGTLFLKKVWQVDGTVADASATKVIVLVNPDSIVVGFGLTGFKNDAGVADPSVWSAVFASEPGVRTRAYAISAANNHACLLAQGHVV